MDIAALPKIELHCHVDGIVHPAMARAIRDEDPSFPVDPDELERAYPINTLETFFNWWRYTDALQGLDVHYPILKCYIAELKQQQVRYAEIMIATGELSQDHAEALDMMQKLRDWTAQQENGVVQIEYVIAFNRRRTPEQLAGWEKIILSLHEKGLIVGFALAGPEIGNPVKPFTHSLRHFHEAGLGMEIHAGEWVGAESVWDALEHGFPDRIGHGISLFTDEKLRDLIRERNLHIEFCPTSNLKTQSVRRIEDHPIRKARELGMNFSINTDDPGIVTCSMNSEFALLAETFGFTEADFTRVYQNSLAARFQPRLRVMDNGD